MVSRQKSRRWSAAPATALLLRLFLIGPAIATLLCPAGAGGAAHDPAPPADARSLQLLADDEYFAALLSHLRQAKESVTVVMFLFKATASPGNLPAKVAEELIAAAKRGVRVEVLLERSGHDQKLTRENEEVARRLEKGGVTVYFDQPKRTLHVKAVIIDRRFCLIGSHNLTHAALRFNQELTVFIDSRSLADELLGYIQGIKKKGPVTSPSPR